MPFDWMKTKMTKDDELAQRNPTAFFQELKQRLLAYQTKNRVIEDDSTAVLDRQIAKIIDDADNDLFDKDSGVGIDSSERFVCIQFDDVFFSIDYIL